jgi:hypothetical protein
MLTDASAYFRVVSRDSLQHSEHWPCFAVNRHKGGSSVGYARFLFKPDRLYEFRILDFALKNEDAINRLGDPSHQIEPLFKAPFDILRIWSELVTRLEASTCGLATAYPTIRTATDTLTACRENQPDEAVRGIYDLGIQLINQYTIESTFDLIQLAYVLTPAGRREAYDQMQSHLGSTPPEQPALELEMVDFHDQLADHEERL